MNCKHDPKTAWGFDRDDGVFRCSECGQLVREPPRWLKLKFAEQLKAFEDRLKFLRNQKL